MQGQHHRIGLATTRRAAYRVRQGVLEVPNQQGDVLPLLAALLGVARAGHEGIMVQPHHAIHHRLGNPIERGLCRELGRHHGGDVAVDVLCAGGVLQRLVEAVRHENKEAMLLLQ